MAPPRLKSILQYAAAAVALAGIVIGADYMIHKPVGDRCKSASECRSRTCAGDGYCTKRCNDDASCPSGYTCRASKVYTNRMDLELAAEGVDLGGKAERLCHR